MATVSSGRYGTSRGLGLFITCRYEGESRVERHHWLRPEKSWFTAQGRGFNSRHLHHLAGLRRFYT